MWLWIQSSHGRSASFAHYTVTFNSHILDWNRHSEGVPSTALAAGPCWGEGMLMGPKSSFLALTCLLHAAGWASHSHPTLQTAKWNSWSAARPLQLYFICGTTTIHPVIQARNPGVHLSSGLCWILLTAVLISKYLSKLCAPPHLHHPLWVQVCAVSHLPASDLTCCRRPYLAAFPCLPHPLHQAPCFAFFIVLRHLYSPKLSCLHICFLFCVMI